MNRDQIDDDGAREGLRLVLSKRTAYSLAKEIDCTYQAVQKWQKVPAERVHDVEKASGVPRHLIRPDLYPLERERLADSMAILPPGNDVSKPDLSL